MIATSGFLTALKCTKFVFGWGSLPDPTGGAYSAPQTPYMVLGALLLMGEVEGKGHGGTGSPFRKFLDPPRDQCYLALMRSHCTNKWQAYCVPVLAV